MTAPQLPPEVLALVHGPVGTIAHVELLLALRAAAPAPCDLERLAAAANVTSPAGARQRLVDLEDAGLAAAVEGGRWRYAPRDDGARAAVDALAAMYNEKPVTLVRALYERPTKPLQSFADAFRLRGDRK